MGAGHFDAFVRALPDLLSRRSALTGVVGMAFATLVAWFEPSGAEAKKKRRKKRRKKKRKTNQQGESCGGGTKPCGDTCIPLDQCCGGCAEGQHCCGGGCISAEACCGGCANGEECCNGACISTAVCCGGCGAGQHCCDGVCFASDLCCTGALRCLGECCIAGQRCADLGLGCVNGNLGLGDPCDPDRPGECESGVCGCSGTDCFCRSETCSVIRCTSSDTECCEGVCVTGGDLGVCISG